MTVIVTTNVASRFRGFLASCMLEIAPGVYSAPRLNKGVRQRVWTVCEEWFDDFSDGSIVMTWKDPNEPGGQGIRTLGLPPKEIYEHEGLLLVRTEFTKKQHRMVGTSGQVET